VNFVEREIARVIVNTGKFVKNSGLILIEETTTQNVYYRLSYLISYLLFLKKTSFDFQRRSRRCAVSEALSPA